MVRVLLAVLLALVVVAQAEDVKYSTLVTEGHVVDLGIKLSYTDEDTEGKVLPFNEGKPCPISDETCRTPLFGFDKDTSITIDYKVPAKFSTLNKLGDKVVGEPVEIQFKACYAPDWIKDRKWRKRKDVISKDKRCLKKISTEPITASSTTYKIPSNTPKAEWFITAFVKCKAPNGDKPIVCAVDTTGTLETLIPKEEPAAGVKTSDTIFYKTEVVESRTTGLVAAVIILSICSVSLLVGFFIFEHLTQKNK